MIRLQAKGLSGSHEELQASLTFLALALSDLRPAWTALGDRIADHIDKRWRSRGAGDLPALAERTLYARDRGYGHYRRRRSFIASMDRGHQFWWTGKSMRRALSKRARTIRKRQLVYHFGPEDAIREKLAWMHFGNAKGNRPPRPVYDEEARDRIAIGTLSEYLQRVLRIANQGRGQTFVLQR